GTLVAVVLLVYLLSQQGWQEIGAAVGQIPAWRFVLALALILISRLAVSGRWYVLLRSAGIGMSPGQSIRITFAGLFASNFLPTTIGGDVIRLAGAVQLNFDTVISAASLVVDRLVGMAGMAMILPFGLPRFLMIEVGETSLFRSIPGRLVTSAAVLPLGKWWRTVLERSGKIFRKLIKAISIWVGQPRAVALSLLYSWVHMVCVFGAIWLFFGGMGQDIPFLLVGGLYSLVYFVTLLPVSINGYGLQEVSMTFIFSVVAGATVQSSLTAALLFRTAMMLGSLPGAIFVPGSRPNCHLETRSGSGDSLAGRDGVSNHPPG
ncbi:MAG: lysylphosphatidylglycerol synthase transmembrane domain-containing protein, partial [Anaerolineales bacterium]